MAWPPATYDVISRNHSNWPSLNLSQNVREGWTKSYWKREVPMFYPLEKNSKKPSGGGIHPHPPPPCTSEGYLGGSTWSMKVDCWIFVQFFFLTGMGHSPHEITPWGLGVAICIAYFHPKATQHGWTHQEPNYKVPTSIIKAHKSPDHVCFASR